jgi:uncharacterized protein YcbK (DUF882 family)
MGSSRTVFGQRTSARSYGAVGRERCEGVIHSVEDGNVKVAEVAWHKVGHDLALAFASQLVTTGEAVEDEIPSALAASWGRQTSFRHCRYLTPRQNERSFGDTLRKPRLRSVVLRSREHGALYTYVKLSASALALLLFGTNGTQDAVANGDTRTIDLVHTHTKETASITFKRNGTYDAKALQQLDWFLRDWRSDQLAKMEPRLFDVVWEVYRSVRASEGVHVVSAYRAPGTNAMLRRRSKGVSKHSQHMAGKAMDLFLPGVDIAKVRATAMRLQHGGVGFYPSPAHSFVHVDVGSVRAWPRMTRGQLLALFPDGKTVHLPSSGPPLPRYEEARAEILARGATGSGVNVASVDGGRRRSLSAMPESAVPASALALTPMPPRQDIMALTSFALPPVPPSLSVEIASAGIIPVATRTDGTGSNERGPEITSRPAGAAVEDRAQVRALFAAALSRLDAGAQVKVATARVRPQLDAPIGFIAEPASGFRLRFSAGTGDELSNRFTGPAVKLPSLLR